MLRTFPIRYLALAALLLAAALLPACTAAAAGAAVGAAQSGVALIKQGRVTSSLLVTYEDAQAAVESAAVTLALDTRRIVRKDGRVSYYFREPSGGKIDVHVNPRTETVTSVVVDVGATGRADVSRLMYAQIVDDLDDNGAFLEDWRPQTAGVPAAGHD